MSSTRLIILMADATTIVFERAAAAWRAAWDEPRWGFQHGDGPLVPLLPSASVAIDAGAREVPVGDATGIVDGDSVAVDGNVHTLVRAALRKEDIVIAKGRTSAHLDVDRFLTEMHLALDIEPERIFALITAGGTIDTAIAPSLAWVDPLVRRCLLDYACVQQFLLKYKVGGVSASTLRRVFGHEGLGMLPSGTPDALAPFLAPVRVVLGGAAVKARYHNTVAELLDFLGPAPVYLNGVQLQRCTMALWTLSPCSHGTIHLYHEPARQTELRTTIGGMVQLPAGHRTPAFSPCLQSFTGNAFAPAQRHTYDEIAALAPAQPTALFMQLLTLGEPMTVSFAQCIYHRLGGHYEPDALKQVLVSMALPGQAEAMRFLLDRGAMPVHPAFARYAAGVAASLR